MFQIYTFIAKLFSLVCPSFLEWGEERNWLEKLIVNRKNPVFSLEQLLSFMFMEEMLIKGESEMVCYTVKKKAEGLFPGESNYVQ